MKFVYIIENDERLQKELFDSIKSLDPNLIIRFFFKLDEFHEWLKLALREGRSTLNLGGHSLKLDTGITSSTDGEDELSLLIASTEMLDVQNLSLLKRAKIYFIRQNICKEDNPTSFLLTTFDDIDLSNQPADDLVVSNLIYKPFDSLILKQHLEYALNGRKLLTPRTIAPLKINTMIEMLKSVKVISVSEVGFQIKSRNDVSAGTFQKYYGEYFATEDRTSILGICEYSRQVGPKEFICDFKYFAKDNKQVAKVRKAILTDKKNTPEEIKNLNKEDFNILLLDAENRFALDLRTIFVDKIANAKVHIYNSQGQLISDLTDKESLQRKILPPSFDLVAGNYSYFSGENEKSWAEISQHLSQRAANNKVYNYQTPPVVIYTNQGITDDQIKELSKWVKDIFFMPFDKLYLAKKIFSLFPKAATKEPSQVAKLEKEVTIKIATPVEITEISEAGLTLRYNSILPIGTFGEFYLLRKGELKAPEILGVVNYLEQEKDPAGSFLLQFVFFGMKDIFLKHLRLWLREAFIKAKEKK